MRRSSMTPADSLPLSEVQGEVADTMDAIDRQVHATADEVSRSQIAREALLDALLTHKIDVTPSAMSV